MMRRLVVAILLIAAGLGVLHFAIGFENFAKVDGGPQDEPIRRTHDERGLDGGVRVGGDDDETAAISVSGSGEFRDVEREEHVLPDGSRLRLRVYELVAEDSETVADDLVRLDRVTVRFFRIETEPAPPHEVLEGSLTARQAFLQFEKDEEGEPSIREDRDMDLRDVVLESTAESRIPGLRLVVERLLVRQTEQGIDFRTPTEDVPLELTLAARDGEVTSLRGRGVRGVLPPRSDAPGAVLEIHVSSSPVFVHGGSSIRARGPLDYVEDVGSGLGELALRDDVVLEGLPGDDGEAADGHARGERLAGRLLRPRPDARSDPDRPRSSRVAWSDLVLAGDGARRVELVQGTMRLSCDRLAVHPAIDGEPAVFIAEGAPSLTDPTLPPATAPRFRAADRIHVVDVARYVGGLHRAFGDPAPWLGRLAGRLVIFEGRASVQDPARGLSIDASDGIRLLQGVDDDLALVVGKGQVEVRGEGLAVSGPMGFVLRQDGARQNVRLGPERADPAHAFVLERDQDGRIVRLTGSGRCEIERDPDGATRIDLRSPLDDIALERPGESLRGLGSLDATIGGDGGLQRFVARGARTALHTILAARDGRPGETLTGEAAEIATTDGRSFVLTGDAAVGRAAGGRVQGDVVEVHRLGGDDAILVARGTPARTRAPVGSAMAGGEPTGSETTGSEATGGETTGADPTGGGPAGRAGGIHELELEGDELWFAPRWVPRRLLALHGIDARLAPAVASRIAVARDHVVARTFDDAGEVRSTFAGERLLLRPDGVTALLTGPPARVESLTEDGRRIVARAPRIRAVGGSLSAQRAVLLPDEHFTPQLEVHGRDGERAFRAFRIACEVPIDADDLGVSIDGPFQVRGLDADGDVDPDGIALDARSLQLFWQPGTRSVERLIAHGDAELRYRGMRAYGDELRVDAVRTTLEVESRSAAPAGVDLGGRRLLGELFRADYEAQQVQAWGLRGGDAR